MPFQSTYGCRNTQRDGLERTRQVQHGALDPVRYDGDDENGKIVALGGLGPLAEYADRLGLTGGFAGAVPYLGPGMPVVDRGGSWPTAC